MAQQPEESETPDQPLWVNLLGGLAGVVVCAFFLLFVLASLTPNPKADGSVIVDDTANILSPEAEAAIRQIRFPEDFPAVVRTVSTIPKAKIGTFATDLMAEERHWQTLRPRGWLRKYIRHDSPSGPGVYVLVSLDPQLLQIRFGAEIRLTAYQQMLAVGPWYRSQQRFERGAIDQHVLRSVKELAERMHKLADPPWPLNWVQTLSSAVDSEVDDWLAPSDGLFSNLALRGYIRLAQSLGATGSAWRFVAFSVAASVLLWGIGKKLLIGWLLLPRIKASWLRLTLLGVCNLGLLGMLVTAFASLAALSKGRIEDQLALEALGLSFLSAPSFDPGLFSARGGLLLAIPGALVSFVGEIKQAAAAQQYGETRITFEWLVWGCMLFLLPKPIAIVALMKVIWDTGSEIVQSDSENSAGSEC